MRISHVTAHHWRNFTRFDFRIEHRLFVVGPNASGKSSLLDLFQFLGDVAGACGGLAAAIERRGGVARVLNLANRDQGRRMVLDLSLADGGDTWRYLLAIRGDRGTRPTVDEERVERNGVVILDRPDSDDFRDHERLTQTHLEQVVVNREFRRLSAYFAGVQYVQSASHMFGDPGRPGVTPSESYGAAIRARINAVPDVMRHARIDRIEAALRSAAADLGSLRRDVDAADRQGEADLPDGTLRLVELLWPVVSASADDAALLLEEPALSLNSAIVRRLPTVLASACRDRPLPIIVATQRLEMLDDEGVRPEEILVLRDTRDGKTAEVLPDISEVEGELRAGLPISDVVDGLIAPPDLAGLIAVGQRQRR